MTAKGTPEWKRQKERVVPHVASPEEVADRAGSPMSGFVCRECGWIYIQAAGSGRRTCTKCAAEAVRQYDADSLDDLADKLIASEIEYPDSAGNKVAIRDRFAAAFERYNKRKDDWETATEIAADIADGEPSRALIAKVYKDWKSKTPAERERKRKKREAKKSKREKRRPTLEELESERREAERQKVRGMKKGTIRKKWL